MFAVRALQQEVDQRRELEQLQAALKERLVSKEARCEELAERQAEQELLLHKGQLALAELEQERLRRDIEYKARITLLVNTGFNVSVRIS